MRFARLWQRLLGVERTAVVRVEFDEDDEVIVGGPAPEGGGEAPLRKAWAALPGL